jgi:hypothetical protein
LHAALIGRKFALNHDGRPVPVEEAIRAMARLEAEERDRLAKFSALAISAGLQARQVALAERQGEMMGAVLRSVVSDPELGLTDAQRATFPAVLRRVLELAGPVGGVSP